MHIHTHLKRLLVLALFAVSSLGLTTGTVQAQEYTLEPSEAAVSIPVHLPNEGYGVNVLLKKDGVLVLDQSDIRYDWEVSNSENMYLYPNSFEVGCPYDIQSPCPSLNATLKGRSPGRVTVTAFATRNNQLLAKTSIQVAVGVASYSLEPSESEINMFYNGTQPSEYGVSVLLKKNNQLILDQQGVSYRWNTNFRESITVTDYGFQSGCPYNLFAPCPNMHADLSALGLGRTVVTVEALINDSVVAITTFAVNVRNYAVSPSPTASPRVIPVSPSPVPVATSVPPSETGTENYEGEQLLRLQQQIDTLEQRVDTQESLLQRILTFFRRFF